MDKLSIDRSENLSLQAQLVEQLKYHIDTGTWQPGDRLPTVRELALALRLNYNTIRAAYQELERQGYLVTEQGRGTFVHPKPPRLAPDRQATLLEIIDEALFKARALGVSAEEFARTAYARARLFSPREQPQLRLLFTECNQPDMAYYASTIEAGTGLKPELFLIEALKKEEPEFFSQFDLLVTTFFHVAELQELVGPERAVLGLMVEPAYFEVMAEMSHLPQGSRVGLVCASHAGATQMARALAGVGVDYLEFLPAGTDQPESLALLFQEAERIYVSRMALGEVPPRWAGDERVRAYIDDIDPAGLRLLRSQISRLREKK